MAIRSVVLNNFLIFENEVKINFGDNINVIIGENGVGKSTVLKSIYLATLWSSEKESEKKPWKFNEIFCPNLPTVSQLFDENMFIEVHTETNYYRYAPNHRRKYHMEWFSENVPSIFIPTTEMLSHSKGFLALNQKYKLPFDATQIDIIVNASLPETRDVPENMSGILEKISAAIDGTVVQEDDTFYVVKHDGKKIEFSLEAEGLRKLGLIWKLIRNGLLEKDTVLLWDEPEANLNPELYPLVAEILLELQSSGVQIFVATHSYNFAKYLEIRRSFEEQVQFHNLYKDETGAICSTAASTMEELKQNHIMIADEKLLDEVYDM